MKRAFLPCVVLVLAVVTAYASAVLCPFITTWDDSTFVLDNPLVTQKGAFYLRRVFTTHHAGYYAPALWMAFRAQYSLWGERAAGFHAVNVLLHCANACLLMLLLGRVGLGRLESLLAALLWALHPLRVESVAWITELKDVLSTLFVLMALGEYLTWRVKRKTQAQHLAFLRSGHYWLGVLFFALALMSKPVSCVLPLGMVVLDAWLTVRESRPRDDACPLRRLLAVTLPDKAVWLILGAAFGAVMVYTQSKANVFSSQSAAQIHVNALLVPHSIIFHIGKLLLPVRLSAYYVRPQPVTIANLEYLLALIGAASLAGLFVWGVFRRPGLSAAVAWYVIFLLPMSQLVPTVCPLADRYTYVPSMSLAALLAVALGWLMRPPETGASSARRLTTLTAAVLLCIALAVFSHIRLQVWRSGIDLWHDAIAKGQIDLRPLNNYGLELLRAGEYSRARQVLNLCTKSYPDDPTCHYNLAYLMVKQHLLEEARSLLEYHVREWPTDGRGHCSLTAIYLELRMPAEAQRQIRQARGAYVKDAQTWLDVSAEFMKRRMYGDALVSLCEAVDAMPGNAEAWNSLGYCLVQLKRYAEARGAFTKAFSLRPENPSGVAQDIATACLMEKKPLEARRWYERALKLDPQNAFARKQLTLIDQYLERQQMRRQ